MLATRPKTAQARAENSVQQILAKVVDTRSRQRAERQARLEQALRNNLRRRKAQARERAVEPASEELAGEAPPTPEKPADCEKR